MRLACDWSKSLNNDWLARAPVSDRGVSCLCGSRTSLHIKTGLLCTHTHATKCIKLVMMSFENRVVTTPTSPIDERVADVESTQIAPIVGGGGWAARRDERTGDTYYVHPKTNMSQWGKPEEFDDLTTDAETAYGRVVDAIATLNAATKDSVDKRCERSFVTTLSEAFPRSSLCPLNKSWPKYKALLLEFVESGNMFAFAKTLIVLHRAEREDLMEVVLPPSPPTSEADVKEDLKERDACAVFLYNYLSEMYQSLQDIFPGLMKRVHTCLFPSPLYLDDVFETSSMGGLFDKGKDFQLNEDDCKTIVYGPPLNEGAAADV